MSPFEEGITKVGTFTYVFCVLGVFVSSCSSLFTIWGHLKNYRRPDLQRLSIRILLMIPVYGWASLISLNSRSAAFFIDTLRDVYEAFVIYSFFILLINYLDGERAILIRLRGRLRVHHLWPFHAVWPPIDMADPQTLTKIQRGVLQFAVCKPLLAVLIMVLKAFDAYDEGYIAWTSSYLWISLAYNLSIQLSADLKPYRPMPKFICVKSIIFLTFWQGLFIAFLSWAGVITDGEAYSRNNLSQAYQDALLCLEMPLFAWMHWYGPALTIDYEDKRLSSRMQVLYALRDCLGHQDIVWDTRHAFPTFLSFFWHSDRTVFLPDDDTDELAPIRPVGRNYTTYVMEPSTSLEFDIDPREESEYAQARNLVFGDFHFPVIHDDWRHPPDVQVIINKNATDFYDNLNAGSARASTDDRQSGASQARRPQPSSPDIARELVWSDPPTDDDVDEGTEVDPILRGSASVAATRAPDKGKNSSF
ncbi:hypothetical protein HDU91_001203 [Kappamyces sp. JEL0680]|nr:hypothetical protein HDU91_001203 [Kappamyces sp. JEL0680]